MVREKLMGSPQRHADIVLPHPPTARNAVVTPLVLRVSKDGRNFLP